jgi:hypothetical protein
MEKIGVPKTTQHNLPVVQLSEFKSFIQINSGNPNSIDKFISFGVSRQAHVSFALKIVGIP